jgi:hypothetical protein
MEIAKELAGRIGFMAGFFSGVVVLSEHGVVFWTGNMESGNLDLSKARFWCILLVESRCEIVTLN